MANGHAITTYEQAEAYADKLNAESQKKALGGAEAQADLAGSLQQICKYYKLVEPVLSLVVAFPLIPEKIKKPIREFMAIMKTLCP